MTRPIAGNLLSLCMAKPSQGLRHQYDHIGGSSLWKHLLEQRVNPTIDSPTAAHNTLLRAKGHHHTQMVYKEDPKLASSCAGALCIPKGICVRTGLQQGLSKLRVRALQPRSYRSIRGIGANGITLYFRVRPPAPLGKLLPGPYAVLVKMMQCNQLLFPFAVKPG